MTDCVFSSPMCLNVLSSLLLKVIYLRFSEHLIVYHRLPGTGDYDRQHIPSL